MAVEYVCYFYGGKFSGPELNIFRCPNCSRKVFSHNSTRIIISNAYGADGTQMPAGLKDDNQRPLFIDYRCHGCKSLYKILFQ
jgi:DNA-directed RNA polymerase subunit RPC12/RpoP